MVRRETVVAAASMYVQAWSHKEEWVLPSQPQQSADPIPSHGTGPHPHPCIPPPLVYPPGPPHPLPPPPGLTSNAASYAAWLVANPHRYTPLLMAG